MSTLIPFNIRSCNGLNLPGNDLFHDIFDDFFGEKWLMPRRAASGAFKIDVEDKGNEYSVSAELPGVAKEEISLAFEDGVLTISVNRAQNAKEEKRNFLYQERRITSMSRGVYLEDVQAEGIEAKLEDGILLIKAPKNEKKDVAKKIEIK